MKVGQQRFVQPLRQQGLLPCRFWLVTLCAGLLSISAVWLVPAVAVHAAPVRPIENGIYASAVKNTADRTATIPAAVVDRLRQDLSKRTKIPAARFKLVQATPKTWSNGCLDLARSDEMCSQALVDGWRVIFTDGRQRWIYRTDKQGRNRRLEAPTKP